MGITEDSLIKNELSELPYCFVLDDIIDRLLEENTDFTWICRSIENDECFICVSDDEHEGKTFITKSTLYNWLVRLNLRLAENTLYTLSERTLLLQMNNLRLRGRWDSIPIDYINFGQSLGLIYPQWGKDGYIFPLAYIMSFFSKSNIKAARDYLLNRSYDQDVFPQFEQLILENLQEALKHLTSKQQYITVRRQGILGYKRMTLEQLGQELNLTRERIRQIEGKSWKRIWHSSFGPRFVPLLLIYALNRKGSLIASSNLRREIEFICKCLNVPLWIFPHTNLLIIGIIDGEINLPENLWMDLFNKETVVNHLCDYLPLQLTRNDIETIARILIPTILKRLTKVQKVYLALNQIGRPAHFAEVSSVYMDLFPEDYSTEHSIHAALLWEKDGIVWIGAKGTFALEEWGFERPSLSLQDTITKIVSEKYQETGNPVPFIVIQAEIGKYRKFVNLNSIFIASHCNPELKAVHNECFIPIGEAVEENEVDDDKLDRILAEFEMKTKGDNRL